MAIFFAQHYADKKGEPTKKAWQRVLDAYGENKAYGILGVIRMIMFGNAIGIAFSAFKSRLNKKKIEKSSLGYELSMMLSLILFIPAAIIHSLISRLFNKPVLSFNKYMFIHNDERDYL